MLTSFAPLRSVEAEVAPLSVEQMTRDVFNFSNMLAECEQEKDDKQMACCLVYRGDVSSIESNEAVDKFKRDRTINLVDWCPTGFKVGRNDNAPADVSDS